MPVIQIDKLVYGGDGLARFQSDDKPELNGQIVFVPYSAPDESVEMTVDLNQKKPLRAQLQQVITPSKHRIEPKCSVFGPEKQCGGCHWQHLDYPAQLLWKQRIVEESLTRIGKLTAVQVQPTIGMESAAWQYRNKVQWIVNNGALGYYQSNSHTPVIFDTCHIIPDTFQQIADWLRQTQEAQAFLNEAAIHQITVRSNHQQELLVIFHTQTEYPETQSTAFAQGMARQFPAIQGIIIDQPPFPEILMGNNYLRYQFAGRPYHVSWDSFFQVNLPVAEKMLACIQDWLKLAQTDVKFRLLDLFAGVGTFTFGLADLSDSIDAIESQSSAFSDADATLALNPNDAIHYHEGLVEDVIYELEGTYDITLLDPPRAGCKPPVLNWVAKNTTEHIVYVSCDPTTLARDLKLLCQNGWRITHVQPFDMFPQTYHIETIVMLSPLAGAQCIG